MKQLGLLFILIVCIYGMASASKESGIKAGITLNRGDENFYSWVVIYEMDYFIKDLISIGYETQFSYYKIKSSNNIGSENRAFPLNVFVNSKVKILRDGIVRPYTGVGIGLLTTIINYHQEFGTEKYDAFHALGGISIGKSSKASFQVEIRVLRSGKENSNTKFLLVCGIQY